MKRLITIILSAFCLACCAMAQGSGTLQSRLSRDSILIGDQVEWVIPFELKVGEDMQIGEAADPLVPGVETIKKLYFDTLSTKKSVTRIEAKMVLTSFDSGSYTLPELVAIFHKGGQQADTLLVVPPVLNVNTIPIDTATYQIKDIKGQIKYPVTFKEIFPYIAIVLVAGGLIFLLVSWIVNRRRNRTLFGKPIVQDPPHIVALRELDRIRGQKLWQSGRQKQFYTAVTDALRLYINGRYDIATMERTSAEILADLSGKSVEKAQLEAVSDLFSTADLVKFAKYEASAEENENAIPVAVRFINSTYMDQIEEEKKEA